MRSLWKKLLRHNLLCILVALALAGCASAIQKPGQSPTQSGSPIPDAKIQPVQKTAADTVDRPTAEPYTGDLSIFEDPKRDQNLQIDRVMEILGIHTGSNAADIGAGSGWFTVRAARLAGSGGIVYAVDINREYLDYIEKRAKRENLTNIRVVLGTEEDPKLPQRSIDAVLLLKTHHEVAQPIRLLKRTRESMRSGALLGIIDRNGKGDDHGIDSETILKEARRAGFELVNQYDFVKSEGVDYFLVFRAE